MVPTDFKDARVASNTINRFVSLETNGRIRALVRPSKLNLSVPGTFIN